MVKIVGIRREDKNKWEARVPLVPSDLADLAPKLGVEFVVQPSPIRAFLDDEYRRAGLKVDEDITHADLVMAVKEVPTQLLQRGRVYCYFAHVTKGQPYNMGMLSRVLELGATLLDYERIADENGRRMLFFGRHAGNAGIIDTLACLGERLRRRGFATPFADVKPAYRYGLLDDAKEHLRAIGGRLEREGLPDELRPLVIGITGYGNVSRGVQELLDLLPCVDVPVSELPRMAARGKAGSPVMIRTVFHEEDTVRRKDASAPFELKEYLANPERYEGRFEEHLPHLDVLVNTIYWEARFPRLVTAAWARRAWQGGASPRLQVIGDISCDIGGSIEPTVMSTEPDKPAFVWNPADGTAVFDLSAHGPLIMSVDNLPCELPRESSRHFSSVLSGMLPDLVSADWNADFASLVLPPHLKRAIVAHRGELSPNYAYLREHLEAAGGGKSKAGAAAG